MLSFCEYLIAIYGVCRAMPASELVELEEWESKNLGNGVLGTADWPGFVKYLGPKPTIEEREHEPGNLKFIYLMRDSRNGYTKIGISKDPKYREQSLQSEVPQVHLLVSFRCLRKHEKLLHQMYKTKRVRGEWFNLTDDDIKNIRDYLADQQV